MKKALLPALLVMTVLVLGMGLAYLLYTFMPSQQALPTSTETKTEIITKEVKVPAEVPNKKNLKEIIKATQDKVVQIETSNGLGSGFLYNQQGDIVTNAHVVGYEVNVTIRMSNEQTYQGKVIGRSDKTDIALVRVPELADKPPLKMKSTKSELGDDVVALGSPLGLQNTVTIGIISGLDRLFTLDPFVYENMYQITAPISPGNSGGPIVSSIDGAVLGINSVKYVNENIGFSIPIYTVLPTLNKWSEHPMELSDNEVDYNYEVPIYEGDLTEDYDDEDSDEDYSQEYGTDEGYDIEEEYSEEEPYEEDYYEEGPYAEGLTADEAVATVYTYYDYVNSGDYEQAYNLIGGNWKTTTPSLEEFAAGYEFTLSSIITDYSFHENGDGTFQVDISLEAQEYVNESERTSYYEVSYIVGFEDNVLKLLGGEMR
ncbi:trypsin-like peptidase domain-containing protein [Fictibacillus sp. UD]|uniref:S1C family serine protease n=1 Tax=Fictibacillus sp. UD TaxID=3038777 RepID=UPI003747281A